MEPLESWVEMFKDGADEGGEGEEEKEVKIENPDFHVVIALDPQIDPKKGHNGIHLCNLIIFKKRDSLIVQLSWEELCMSITEQTTVDA